MQETNLARDELYWQAVLRRDPSMDGEFLYAVLSTGVFCRPTCPSRRPSRSRVRFFASAEEAQRAGFRPCRRCRPLDAAVDVIREVCRFIDDNLDRSVSLDELGHAARLSPFHLQRKFKAALGVTPREYADARRLERLKAEMKNGERVTSAIYGAGYGSSSRVYEKAPAQLGMTPGAYRAGAGSVQIRYTIESSPIGLMLVGATDAGVCAIQFGDSEAALIRALEAEYPKALIRRDELLLQPWIEPLQAYLRGENVRLDLPLDIRATAFQRRVWKYLQQIPYGETRSYSQIARDIGSPNSTRAVAGACASNRIAVAIPCHRVVRAGGEMGGYKWGTERKQRLLALEARDKLQNRARQ
jgi:AraC family transcriptional regulator of adaptative response/methylated-DNA-[protein]-cysteine methyltransferase